jgi:hypothetical protein
MDSIALYRAWEKDKNIIVMLKNRLERNGKRNIQKENKRYKIDFWLNKRVVKLKHENSELSTLFRRVEEIEKVD